MSKDETTDRDATLAEFKAVVNMTPAALKKWLAGEDSQTVGMLPGGGKKAAAGAGESVGHHMGERILALKAAKAVALTDADLADMRKVVGYVKRHMAQRPEGDVSDTRWRKSLMNWGHDPLT